ncbi:hypothetical protein AB0E65_28835, partial [Streptomyces fragilis]
MNRVRPPNGTSREGVRGTAGGAVTQVSGPGAAPRGAAAGAGGGFVEGEAVEDGNGHGTHCIGTVAGPADPA